MRADRPGPGLDIYRKLSWTLFGRLLVTTALLAATAVAALGEPDSVATPLFRALFAVAGTVYALSLVWAGALRWLPRRHVPWVGFGQIAGDVALATVLVWLTGGRESIFVFLFSLTVIVGALSLERAGAWTAAALSSLAYALMAVGMQTGWWPAAAPYLAVTPLPGPQLVSQVAINAGALFLIGWLAAHLSEQVRRAGEQLTVVREDYRTLAALHRGIVESVGSGILTLDGDGRITFINRAGADMLGARLAGSRGRLLAEVLPPLSEALESATPDRVVPRGELRLEGRDGPEWLGFTVTPLATVRPAQGDRVVVFQDLTALRRMEQAMATQDRLAALGELAAGLAHELRNPLASMSGSVQVLKGLMTESKDERRLLDIVLREADRLEDLVRDFLLFARPAPPSFETVDLEAAVAEALSALGHDPDVASCTVTCRVDPSARASVDRRQLHQVLLNLVLNAAQACGPGGRVTVEGRQLDHGVELTVEDDGPGLDAARQRHVFDPFFTTKDRGTGLGLAVVDRIVQAHGGRIEVESSPGQGSRFVVRLPPSPVLQPTGSD